MYDFKKNHLEIDAWKKWYLDLVLEKPKPYTGAKQNKKTASSKGLETHNYVVEEDEIALEVLVYRKKLTEFGGLNSTNCHQSFG